MRRITFLAVIPLTLLLASCMSLNSSVVRVILPSELYVGKPFEMKVGVVGPLGFLLRNVEVKIDGRTYTTDESGYARVQFFFFEAGSYNVILSYGDVSREIVLNVKPASWLVLCWFGADNNLSQYVSNDFEEMRSAAKDVAVIAFVDQYEVLNDGVYALSIDGMFVRVEPFNETNSGSGTNLSWFVNKYGTCDANKKALILWNHGNAWNDTDPYTPKGISYDDQSRDFLTTLELKNALQGTHWDVLGFDACLMGSVEVLYELKDLVDYFLASPGEIPSSGWDYRFLASISDSDSKGFCEKAIDRWRSFYTNKSYEPLLNAWDSEKLSEAVSSLVKKMNPANGLPAVSTVYSTSPRLCDLGEVLESFGWSDVLSQFQSARIPEATGSTIYLSVFLPRERGQIDTYREIYSQLSFASDTGWLDWLNSLFR
ncbi:clostripain-related cysteine peptidase [Pseudothermotoga sp.]